MPLSEHEQRILRQIEQQLEQDPTFATRGYRVARSRLVLLIVGLLGAIVLTVLGLSVSFWLAFAGFLVVLAVAVALEREVRLLARERLGTLPISAWLGGGAVGGNRRTRRLTAGRRGDAGQPRTGSAPDGEVAADAAAGGHRVGGDALDLAAPPARARLAGDRRHLHELGDLLGRGERRRGGHARPATSAVGPPPAGGGDGAGPARAA